MAFGVVHHWDGSFDGVAALSASKERVPADSTRFAHGNRVPSDGTRYDQRNRVPSDGTRYDQRKYVPSDGTRSAQDVRPSLMTTVLSTMTT